MTVSVNPMSSLPALILLGRLADCLIRPISHFHPTQLGDFGDDMIRALGAHPAFARRMELAASEELGLNRFALDEATFERLRTNVELQIAVLATTAGHEELINAARLLAAAVLHRRLSNLVLKADRDRAIRQVGATAFQVAVREAATLYSELETLGPEKEPDLSDAGAGNDPGTLDATGLAALKAFVETVEPELGRLFALRLHSRIGRAARSKPGPRCRAQIVNLFRRKMPGWAACIA